MNKAQKLRFYIEALCVYDLKKDEVVQCLLRLLQSVGSEKVLEMHGEFFRAVTRHRSFREYLSRLILTDDNAFTKAAAAGRAVMNGSSRRMRFASSLFRGTGSPGERSDCP